MLRDNITRKNFCILDGPHDVTNHTTYESNILDVQGARAVAILAIVNGYEGNDGGDYAAFVLQESDDTVGADFTPVAASDLVRQVEGGPIPGGTVSGEGDLPVSGPITDDSVYRFGYIGSMRYLRLQVAFTGTAVTHLPITILGLIDYEMLPSVDPADIVAS